MLITTINPSEIVVINQLNAILGAPHCRWIQVPLITWWNSTNFAEQYPLFFVCEKVVICSDITVYCTNPQFGWLNYDRIPHIPECVSISPCTWDLTWQWGTQKNQRIIFPITLMFWGANHQFQTHPYLEMLIGNMMFSTIAFGDKWV